MFQYDFASKLPKYIIYIAILKRASQQPPVGIVRGCRNGGSMKAENHNAKRVCHLGLKKLFFVVKDLVLRGITLFVVWLAIIKVKTSVG